MPAATRCASLAAGARYDCGQVGDQERPAQEPERLGETRAEAKGSRNPQKHRSLALGEDPMHEQGERNERHRREGQDVPDGDERRAAGRELGQNLSGRLAQDVGVLEELLEQHEADGERKGDDHKKRASGASNGEGIHRWSPFIVTHRAILDAARSSLEPGRIRAPIVPVEEKPDGQPPHGQVTCSLRHLAYRWRGSERG